MHAVHWLEQYQGVLIRLKETYWEIYGDVLIAL